MSYKLAARLQPFFQRVEASKEVFMPSIVHYSAETRNTLNEMCSPIMKLDRETQTEVQNLMSLAKDFGCASQSAPQVGSDKTFFCVLKPQYLKPGRWLNYNYYPVPNIQSGIPLTIFDYELYINPLVISSTINSQNDYDWEYCISFPNMKSLVKRPSSVKVSYLDGNQQLQEKVLSGFQSRLFLHEFDHIKGQTIYESNQEYENSATAQKKVELSDLVNELFGKNSKDDVDFEVMKLKAERDGEFSLKDTTQYLKDFEERREQIIEYLSNHQDFLTNKYGNKYIDENLLIM